MPEYRYECMNCGAVKWVRDGLFVTESTVCPNCGQQMVDQGGTP